MIKDSYQTIANSAQAELKVKGSRFLGFAAPAVDKIAAESYVDGLRKQFFDATHHCYAYRCGYQSQEYSRFSDDGEPSGTAGKPILHAIQGHDLTNLVVVIVRYFGGVKLGTGGLARAYADTAALVLEQTPPITQYHCVPLKLKVGYEQLSAVLKLLQRHHAVIVSSDYADCVRIRTSVRAGEIDVLQRELIDATHGHISIFLGDDGDD